MIRDPVDLHTIDNRVVLDIPPIKQHRARLRPIVVCKTIKPKEEVHKCTIRATGCFTTDDPDLFALPTIDAALRIHTINHGDQTLAR